jgi:hypothetical protein
MVSRNIHAQDEEIFLAQGERRSSEQQLRKEASTYDVKILESYINLSFNSFQK